MTITANGLERVDEIRISTPREFARQRLGDVANNLSLAGQVQIRVELANEALHRLADLAYQCDSDGVFANIDERTYRFLIPVPWGRKGYQQWGLRSQEAIILRTVLLTRQYSHKKGDRPLLFIYNPEGRYWFLNGDDYANIQAAGLWLRYSKITLGEWRGTQKLVQDVRNR